MFKYRISLVSDENAWFWLIRYERTVLYVYKQRKLLTILFTAAYWLQKLNDAGRQLLFVDDRRRVTKIECRFDMTPVTVVMS